VAAGKQADLVLLDGDLAKDITAIENPEIVFKSWRGLQLKRDLRKPPRAGWNAVTD